MKIHARSRFRTVVLAVLAVFAAACSAPRRRPEELGPDAKLEKAYELIREDKPADAAALMSEILKVRPTDGRVRLELAYLEIRLKRWKEAVDLLDAAIEENPDDMRLRMERGYVRLELGQTSAAADEFGVAARAAGEFQAPAQAALEGIKNQTSEEGLRVREDALLNAGYDDLRTGAAAQAREKFKAALDADPGRTEVSKQLGYMSMADGDLPAAARRFEGVRLLDPGDAETALELGYIEDALHNEVAATKAFKAALASPDPGIRTAAAVALENVRAASRPLYLDVTATPMHTARFADRIAVVEANLGWKPRPDWPLDLFLGGRYTQDSRSRSGTEPQIYEDNFLSVGPGLKIQPRGWNASLSAEWDVTRNLMRSSEHPRATEGDARVVLADYHYWEGPLRTFADAGANVGYYARYRENVIGYFQGRVGGKPWTGRRTTVALYAPVNALKDSNKDYFNNLVEAGVGLEVQPLARINFKVRAEAVRGFYMGIHGRDPNPYGRVYNDVRVTLIYSGRFVLPERKDDFQPTKERPFRW